MGAKKRQRIMERNLEKSIIGESLKSLEIKSVFSNICASVAGSLYTIFSNLVEQQKLFTVLENPLKKTSKLENLKKEKVDQKEKFEGKIVFVNKRNDLAYSAFLKLEKVNFYGNEVFLPFFCISAHNTKEEFALYGAPAYSLMIFEKLKELPSLAPLRNVKKLETLLDYEFIGDMIDKEARRLVFDLTGHTIELTLD